MLPVITFANMKWLVLTVDKIEKKALLLSAYNVGFDSYDNPWRGCSLRKWLNTDFLEMQFSEEERDAILSVYIDEIVDPTSEETSIRTIKTKNKVFLLSIEEVKKYLIGDDDKVLWEEGYYDRDEDSEKHHASYDWWLRSPGDAQEVDEPLVMAFVDDYGTLAEGGRFVYSIQAIRPAIWIDLKHPAIGN